MYAETNLPMFNAYNAHAFYLTELRRYFEKAVVINMRRYPTANAVSLLRARKKYREDIARWWSIKPAACNENQIPDPYHQIACQIIETYRAIKAQRSHTILPIIDINYEQLCIYPEKTLEDIVAFCRDAGIQLEDSNTVPPLPDLQIRGPRPNELKDTERFTSIFDLIDWQGLWS